MARPPVEVERFNNLQALIVNNLIPNRCFLSWADLFAGIVGGKIMGARPKSAGLLLIFAAEGL